MRTIIAVLATLLCASAQADDKWVYEFEFDYGIPRRLDRLLEPSCTKVVPSELASWYVQDPRKGWEIACGNKQPMYQHFLGRRCGKPLPKLTFECGWRHFSSPADSNEITFDAFAFRGRFSF